MQSRLFSRLFSPQAWRTRYLRTDPLFKTYWREVQEHPVLSEEEEATLLAQTAMSSAARNKLMEGNLRLVILIAVAFQDQGLSLSELIQEGNLGLLHAIERFDPKKTRRLSTYAKYWIVQSIQQALRRRHTASFSEHTAQLLAQMERHLRQAEAQGIELGPHDLAVRCQMSVEQVMALLPLREEALSLQHTSLETGPLSEIVEAPPQLLPDPQPQPLLSPALSLALSHLSENEQKVLCLRFGVDGVAYDNYHEIAWLVFNRRGKRVDERIRQIEKQALVKVRAFLERKEPPIHERRRRPSTTKSIARNIPPRRRKEAHLDEGVPCS